MSHLSTPFIVVNLGCEMIYVIEQRLKAQHIPTDKSVRVLTDICTVLLHPKLLEELFLPQPVATHVVIKQLLQDISSTSIMKLDDYSMNKLWDLMTMIMKWQLSVSVATTQNIFDITFRHLKSVATIMPEFYPKYHIEEAMKKFETLRQKFTDSDYTALKNTLLLWFSEYHTKISVLLRLGLQNKDGTFCLSVKVNQNILVNLGENIYKHETRNDSEFYESACSDTQEITCLLGAIAANTPENKIIELQLPIDLEKTKGKRRTLKITQNSQFESISTSIKNSKTELNFLPITPKTHQEYLLEMLSGDN